MHELEPLIRAVQTKLGIPADGIAGPQTWNALYKHFYGEEVQHEVYTSARSENLIHGLLGPVQYRARQLWFNARKNGIYIEIISGTRTYAEQDALYAKGRTAPGPKVTNAPGGYSNHNFGIAFDVGIFNGKYYLPESPLYKKVGELGKSLGLSWGGDWKSFTDEPHFEYNPKGYSIGELRERKAAGLPLI